MKGVGRSPTLWGRPQLGGGGQTECRGQSYAAQSDWAGWKLHSVGPPSLADPRLGSQGQVQDWGGDFCSLLPSTSMGVERDCLLGPSLSVADSRQLQGVQGSQSGMAPTQLDSTALCNVR